MNRASLVAQMVKKMLARQENQVQSLGQEDPLEKGMALQYYCLEAPNGQRRLVGYSPWVTKSQTQLNKYYFHFLSQLINSVVILSNTIHKNKLKMDKRSKCKTRNYKTPRGEHRKNTLRHKSQQDPL